MRWWGRPLENHTHGQKCKLVFFAEDDEYEDDEEDDEDEDDDEDDEDDVEDDEDEDEDGN